MKVKKEGHSTGSDKHRVDTVKVEKAGEHGGFRLERGGGGGGEGGCGGGEGD